MDNHQIKGKNSKIRLTSNRSYKFYFVEPQENANTSNIAEKLINIKEVEEVFVTDGDYGFIVKAKYSDGKEDNAYKYLSRLGGNFGKVTSYYQYKK